MKQLTSNTMRNLVYGSLLIFSLASCQKESVTETPQAVEELQGRSNANILNRYHGVPSQTMWELQQARSATAKYAKVDKALKDGYVDINVILPNMGYHYMKPSLVDGHFDPREPEILVYNKDDNGELMLVAVEYAVPNNLPTPSGFSGNLDVWVNNTVFGLHLLHAWVWEYNPAGVFNGTNANVHVH